MSYEKTVWAGEGTLAREQEYNDHWCYERGIITKAWLDVYAATGDRRFYDAAKANVDQYVTADGEILTYEPDKYNLDMICMGRTALRLFKATGEAKYEKACRRLIEQIKGQPTTVGLLRAQEPLSPADVAGRHLHGLPVSDGICRDLRRDAVGGSGGEADDADL